MGPAGRGGRAGGRGESRPAGEANRRRAWGPFDRTQRTAPEAWPGASRGNTGPHGGPPNGKLCRSQDTRPCPQKGFALIVGKISPRLNAALILPNKADKFPVLSELVNRVNTIPVTPSLASCRHRRVIVKCTQEDTAPGAAMAILEEDTAGAMTPWDFGTRRSGTVWGRRGLDLRIGEQKPEPRNRPTNMFTTQTCLFQKAAA